MKFGKEFASQMVPEWQEAYMNYNYLKTLLKQILKSRQKMLNKLKSRLKESSLRRKKSLFRTFSGLTSHTNSKKNDMQVVDDDQVIIISAMQQADEEQGKQYLPCQTSFFKLSEEGGDLESNFFACLDNEFNKVVNFYTTEVKKVVKHAEDLNKEMENLIALRIKVHNVSSSTIETNTGSNSLEVIQESTINAKPETTPMSTVNNYNKNELKDKQQKLKKAFIEFHVNLRYLKKYSTMNKLAFSKIMKKYDKITSRNAAVTYLQMVEDSYLSQSDEVAKLITRVEATFIKHFSNQNRDQGMKILRPKSKREKHRVTFFVGCYFGCSLALIVAIILSIRNRDFLKSTEQIKYMNTMFPLYSMFGFLVLHMLMYAGNVYFWTRYRVNYSFIFGCKPGTELRFNEVLLISSGLSVLILAAMLANLEMDLDPNTQTYKTVTELLPLGLLTAILLIALCPFNIFYRASRYFFLVHLWHCICAPFYEVTLPDFFLADQFTSQVQLFRSLEFYACYYGWGDFKRRDAQACIDSGIYENFSVCIAVVPYWIRALQCVRRYFEGKDSTQALNALKYFSTIVAVVSRTLYDQRKGMTLKILAASTSGITTIFVTYWDLFLDWGLLDKRSKNPWLRDKLILPNRSIYFIAMVVNVILRLAWMQTVLDFTEAPFLHRNALIAITASLEIIRRGIWNFFRLENEHLNNVGKYRAVKTVPLPFSYKDENKDV
uniref:phosphate transporter PHO1 homolog 9-like n=1 Tax=Erigeron canadensis TaxID=72917 RepID=UPI001CB90D14|nr:phosphate transporter PHO1 homolog 9-like [Erigeron canadensis]